MERIIERICSECYYGVETGAATPYSDQAILCYRYPLSVVKRENDWCGEFTPAVVSVKVDKSTELEESDGPDHEELERRMDMLVDQVHLLEDQIDSLDSRTDSLDSDVIELRNTLELTQEDISHLSSQVNSLESEVDRIERP